MNFFRKKYKAQSDEALMVLLAKGDHQAFGVLYDRYATKMQRYFFRMLARDGELANDLTQDLFLKILERNHLYDPEKRFSTWIYTIASNRCKNEYRSRSRRPFVGSISEELPLEAKQKKPEEQMDQQLFDRALQAAVDELSEAHRETFVFRFQEELSIDEISKIMECPPGTVKSRIHYALKQLSENLRPYNPKYSSYAKRTS